MADADPFAGLIPISDAQVAGRPVLRKGVAPVSPTEQYHPITPQERTALGLPSGVSAVVSGSGKPDVVSLPDKTTYRDMTPAEKAAHHLDDKAPWLIGSDGTYKLPEGYKSADAESAVQKQENIDAADSLINGVRRARGFIGNAFDVPLLGNTATGLGFNVLKHSPVPTDASKLDSVINQEIRGNIFMKRIADLKAANDSPTGGTGIGRIMQAEIPLITGAIGTLDPGKLGKEETLKSLDQIERAALRSKAIFNGENPDDPQVQQKYGIPPLSSAAGSPPAAPPAPGGPQGGPSLGGGPDVNPLANGSGGGGGPQLTPSGGATRSIIDPKQQALGAKIVALMSKGADKNTIMGFAVGASPKLRTDPEFRAWVDQALQYRTQHPKAQFSVDPSFYTTEAPLSESEKIGNAAAQSAPAAAAMGAVNGATAGNYGKIAGALGGDRQMVENAMSVAQQEHPVSSLTGEVGGSTAAMLGGEAMLAKLGLGAGPLRAFLANGGFGAVEGATNSQDPATGAVKGFLTGSLAGGAGEVATRGLGAILKGVTDPTVSYVAKGVPLTLGQAVGKSGLVGKTVKGIEDRLSGIPGVGSAINARRAEGLQKMNTYAFNKALEPIGGNAEGKFGEEAVQHAQGKVSDAFNHALAGKTASLDHGFIADATQAKAAVNALPDSVRGEVRNQIDHVVNNYFDDGGNISGENMQALLQELGGVKRSYQGTPVGHRIGKVVDQFSDSIENLFRRQAPDVMPQYDAAKKAFKRVSTLEDAVLRANNTGGVFTPAQLGMSDRASTVKYGGKHAAAAGKGEFHDFQRNMQEVLPNRVPDSGTAGRLLVPMAAVAAGGAGGEMAGDVKTGLTLGGLLALAYSRTGQKALTAAVLKRGTGARAAGEALRKAAPVVGHAATGPVVLGSQHD